MLDVPQFYSVPRWRDQWNVLRPDGTHHRGHDIACDSHEDIPVVRAGTLVKNGHTSVLGNYAVLKINTTTFDYYCHLLIGSRPDVGAVLAAGDRIGQAAGYSDDHGSAWTGIHLHYGSGPVVTSVTTGTTYNATDIVRGVLTSVAGSDVQSFPVPRTPEQETQMDTCYYQLQTPDGQPRVWGIFGPDCGEPGWCETSDLVTAQAWGKLYGTRFLDPTDGGRSNAAPTRVGAPWGVIDSATWAKMKAQAEIALKARHSLAANVTVTLPPLTITGTVAPK